MTRLDFISLETSFVHFHSTPSTSCSTCLSHFNKISPYSSSSSSSTSPLSASSVSFTSFISLAQPNANLSQLSSSVPTLSGFRNVLSKQNSETFGRSMFTTSGRRNSFSLPPTPSLENSPELPAFASSSGYFKVSVCGPLVLNDIYIYILFIYYIILLYICFVYLFFFKRERERKKKSVSYVIF